MQYGRSFVETKQLISSLLCMMDVEYNFNNTMVVENSIYSTRVEISQLGEGCNGKGTEVLISETCAMAELIERLFSMNLTGKLFRIKKQKEYVKDYINTSTIRNFVNKNLTIADDVKDSIIYYLIDNNYTLLMNFRSLENNEEVKLPIKLINYQCGSNGLSAGNNFYESMIKGIEENFERYCAKQVFLNEYDCNNISENCINDINILTLLDKLKNKKYNVSLKDFSLNGKLPVAGILVKNANNTKAILKVACDVNLDNAISKCLYELFQGRTFDDLFEESFIDINSIENYNTETEYIKFVKNSSGLVNNIISDNKITILDNLKVFRDIKSTKEIYEYLIEVVNNNKMELFYYTHLSGDFFVHQVYISNVSELLSINKDTMQLFQKEKNFVEVFRKINEGRNYEIIIGLLDSLRYVYNDNVITTIYGIPKNMLKKSPYLNDNLLYSWCYFRKQDYKSCIRYLEMYKFQLSNKIAYCMIDKLIRFLHDNDLDKQINNPYFNILLNDYKFVNCPNCIDCFYKDDCSFGYVIDLEKKVGDIKAYDEDNKK